MRKKMIDMQEKKMDIKDLVKVSITKKAGDFKEIFGKLMQSRILDKISDIKADVGKKMFAKDVA